MQRSSQIGALDNIDIKKNWVTPDIKEYTSETPSHEVIVTPDNNLKTLMLLQSKPHVQEVLYSVGVYASEVIEHTDSEGVLKKSHLTKVCFDQQWSNAPSGMPSRKGDKGSKGSKIPKMIDLASTGLRRSSRLANKPKKNVVSLLNSH